MLRRYEERLDNTTVLFPVAALETIENLAALAGGRLMVLSADRGFDREELLLGLDNPRMISHGSFSIPVNYDAIARVIRASGGEFLQSPHAPAHLCVNAVLLGQPAGGYLETAEAFYNSAGRWGPDDFFPLKKGIQKIVNGLDLDETLSALRLSGWDSNLLQHCVPSLAAHSKSATPAQQEELLRAIAEVWENYFPIGGQEDIAALLGQLLLEMHLPAQALRYFEQSLHYTGPSAGAWLRLATAYYRLCDLDVADRYIEQSLAMEPGNGPARALALQVERDRERRVAG